MGDKGLKVGYVRVSTMQQHNDRQYAKMYEVEVDKIFEEKKSGKNIKDRKALQEMLDYVRDGDTVYVESLSRIGRNTEDLLNIMKKLDEKGVSFHSFKENIETKTPTGRLILTVLAAIATFEREIMLERQAEGLAAARARGVVGGNPIKRFLESDFMPLYNDLVKGKISKKYMASQLGCSRTKLWQTLKDYEEGKLVFEEPAPFE